MEYNQWIANSCFKTRKENGIYIWKRELKKHLDVSRSNPLSRPVPTGSRWLNPSFSIPRKTSPPHARWTWRPSESNLFLSIYNFMTWIKVLHDMITNEGCENIKIHILWSCHCPRDPLTSVAKKTYIWNILWKGYQGYLILTDFPYILF